MIKIKQIRGNSKELKYTDYIFSYLENGKLILKKGYRLPDRLKQQCRTDLKYSFLVEFSKELELFMEKDNL